MRLPSLRGRLIAWYVTTGALVVLACAALTAIVSDEALSYQAREAMLSAERQVPTLIASYRAHHTTLQGVDAFLTQRLAPLPIGTHTEGQSAVRHRGAPRRPNQNLLVRLLMEQVRPIDVNYGDMRTVIYIAPSFYERFVSYYVAVIALIAVVVIFGAWRIALVVATNSLDPLLRTTAALNRFGKGDFTPAAVSTNDTSEVGELAQAYNRAVRQITRALDDRAQAAAEMRQFVGDAGHQLRTPLTVIVGYLSAMAARGPRESDATAVTKMLAQSRRMKTLIDELIMLARLEHVAPPNKARFDVNDVVRELPQAFTVKEQGRLRMEIAETPLTVHAAASELREALVAVTDNAIKYGGDGPVTIRAARCVNECEVAVRDWGPGFSEIDFKSAFDRFFRGSASDGTPGTGLGLAIAEKVLARAGGKIELRNVTDGGAECIVRLPLS
ncbi:MAG TPA: HAMP domain-containing sensor histidine kinase [Candidatus Cybelea sp.]